DALGRYLVYGLPSGEIVRLDLEGTSGKRSAAPARPASAAPARATLIREPEWTVPIATTDDQAETAVLAVLETPPRIAVITNRNRLQVLTPTGGILGEAPSIA